MEEEFLFNERLRFSHSPEHLKAMKEILENHGAKQFQNSSLEEDKLGVDIWIDLKKRNHVSVDFKVGDAKKIKYHNMLALEDKSNVEWNTPGWTMDEKKITDVLLFYRTNGLYFMMPYRPVRRLFCQRYELWRNQYPCFKQKQDAGTYSICILVPYERLLEESIPVFTNYISS